MNEAAKGDGDGYLPAMASEDSTTFCVPVM
jgi:hypothetical protein